MVVAVPAKPVSGETVLTDWGKQVIDYEGERYRFVRNPVSGTWQHENKPASGKALLECTQLPAGDPNVVMAECQAMVRGTADNDNFALTLSDYHATPASAVPRLLKYNTGQASRGGMSGGVALRVGGANNRQIVWESTGAQNWIRVLGWWVRDTPPPYPIEGDPIVAGWGKQVTDVAGGAWQYVRVPFAWSSVNDSPGVAAATKITLPGIPVDPDIVAAHVMLMIRDHATDNFSMQIWDAFPDGTQNVQGYAGSAYTEGSAERGGNAGNLVVHVGGAGNNEIWWSGGDSGTSCYIGIFGYFKAAKPGAASLPVPPAPGEPISSAWAGEVIDTAGRKLCQVSVPNAAIVNGVDGQTVSQVAECTNIPANDPRIKYAIVSAMVRDNNGTGSQALYIKHYDDDGTAGLAYSSGVQSRGGFNGPFIVRVGGVNNRQIRWACSEAGAAVDIYVYCSGYYVEDAA